MVDMSNFIDYTLMKLKHIEVGEAIELLTFKKDRKVIVVKEEEYFTLHEDGFYHEVFENLDTKELKKLLKTMVRREFPRSNRLHFQIVKVS